MINDPRADTGCLLIGEYTDEAEVPADAAYHQGEPVRPRVVASYLDVWSADSATKEFTVLLKDGGTVTVRGHGLKVVETSAHADAVSYGVKMDVGTAEVIVALFPVSAVVGIFSGEMKQSRSSA